MRRLLQDRLVVVSPHLDDAVLSLGASIAAASRHGARVSLITVFAGNPDSTKPSGEWDQRAGFATEGEAVRARRAEDRAACALIGAEPVWLGYSEPHYADSLDDVAIGRDVWEASIGASAVLFPGFPLTNPDHVLVARHLADRPEYLGVVGLYAEQPYRYWVRHHLRRPSSRVFPPSERGAHAWTRLHSSPRSLHAKRRAILAYRSQVRLLGLDRGHPRGIDRMLIHELLSRGEAIAWLPSTMDVRRVDLLRALNGESNP